MHIQEIPWIEPAEAFARLGRLPGLSFLDSAAGARALGKISYICLDPVTTFRAVAPCMAGALGAMKALRPAGQPDEIAQGPLPFTGGLVGMISYETGLSGHGLTSAHAPDRGIPAFVVRRYDLVIGFDLAAMRAWICAGDREDQQAGDRIAHVLHLLVGPPEGMLPWRGALSWREVTPYPAYAERIERAKALIIAGDIYQANISTRFVADRPASFSEAGAYLSLRRRSAAPFGAFMDLGEGSHLLSASPERFLALTAGGRVETRPIKGTAPRHDDPAEDARNAARLSTSEKDHAENLMICDLLRNDLAMVCHAGSVVVDQLAAIEQFASVWHLVSVVSGQLAAGRSALDLLAATMPGGSITGAPKRRAMEVIDALEATSRGPNFGCLFWIGDDGAMDSSIIIRSLVTTPDHIIAQAGGGIVADSSAQGEYAELRTKIAPMLALGDEPPLQPPG